MVTITMNGTGASPITTDLMPEEIKNFFGQSQVSLDDVLDLHLLLKKESLWNLLRKKEQTLVKKAKKKELKAKSQP